MKFRLKSGGHREGKKLYKPGDIVESDRDLVAAFVNKFESVLPGTKVEVAEVLVPDVPSTKVPLEKKPAPHRSISRKQTNIHV